MDDGNYTRMDVIACAVESVVASEPLLLFCNACYQYKRRDDMTADFYCQTCHDRDESHRSS